MHRIDTSGAVTVLPAANAPGTPGYFQNAAPGPGVAVTYFDPDHSNAIQEELMAILAAAGTSPVKGTYNQVIASLRQLFGPHGQCRLVCASATQLQLAPFLGIYVKLQGVPVSIGAAGVVAGNTGTFVNGTAGQALAASTRYFVYLFNNAGTLALDFCTTAHATDAATAGNIGVEIKSGDPTRTYVGQVYTNPSGQFQDTPSFMGVSSFFNKQQKELQGATVTGASTTSTTAMQLSSTGNVTFLVGAEAPGVLLSSIGAGGNSTSGYSALTQVGLDGTIVGFYGASVSATGAANSLLLGQSFGKLSEGVHVATPFGAAYPGGTASFIGVQLSGQVMG